MAKSSKGEAYSIRTVPISAIKPAPYNPRAMDPAARAALEQSLKKFGVLQPIIWNRKTGHIVGGHQRFQILRENGAVKIQCVVVEFSERDEKMANLALNNPAAQGRFTPAIEPLLNELQIAGEDLKPLALEGLLPDPPEPVELRDIDTSELQDRFWISLTGPLAKQADVLRKIHDAVGKDGEIEIDVSAVKTGGE